jgi:hypothetical protein
VNDSKKGSNGPAGSRSGKLHSEEQRDGLSVTGRSRGSASPESNDPRVNSRSKETLGGSCGPRLRTYEWLHPSDLDRPGRLPHQQGLSEARLGYRDGFRVPAVQVEHCLSAHASRMREIPEEEEEYS